MTRFYSETEVVARVRGLTVARLRAFVAADCLAPAEREGRLAFAEADVARAQLLEELVEDFELDAEAAAMVVSLVDQIHGLRRSCAGSARRWRPSIPRCGRASETGWSWRPARR